MKTNDYKRHVRADKQKSSSTPFKHYKKICDVLKCHRNALDYVWLHGPFNAKGTKEEGGAIRMGKDKR